MTERGGARSHDRLLAIFDLFEKGAATLTAEAISAELGCSLPTAYRDIRALLDAGFLQRLSGSRYALGPRVIRLDHLLRTTDPVLAIAIPWMQHLTATTGCDCVLSAIYGDNVLDTHREHGVSQLPLRYGRGRPRPLFLGAAPKVLLSRLPLPRLRRLYEAYAAEAAAAGLGDDWPAVRSSIGAIRRRGYHISRGELEPPLCSVAIPVVVSEDTVTALALVSSAERFGVLDEKRLISLLQAAASQIEAEADGHNRAEPQAAQPPAR